MVLPPDVRERRAPDSEDSDDERTAAAEPPRPGPGHRFAVPVRERPEGKPVRLRAGMHLRSGLPLRRLSSRDAPALR